jgi:hypothetical protein
MPVPGLPPWTGDAIAPEVVLRHGPVPERLDPSAWSSRNGVWSIDAARRMVLLRPLGLPAVLVRSGAAVDVTPHADGGNAVAITRLLLGPVAGTVLYQQGIVPLHASSVVVGDAAIAFSGVSGSGKSTIAAALVKSGYPLLSDDITPICFGDDGSAWALSGSPNLWLAPDSAASLASGEAEAGDRVAGEKLCLAQGMTDARPRQLAALVRLQAGSGNSEPQLTRLAGASAIYPVHEIIYRFSLAHRLGRRAVTTGALLKVAAAIPVYRLVLPRDLARLPEAVALVVDTLAGYATAISPADAIRLRKRSVSDSIVSGSPS